MPAAVACYQKAAKLEDAEAMYRLALCYVGGKSVIPDKEEALRLCQKALESQDLALEGDDELRAKLKTLAEQLKS